MAVAAQRVVSWPARYAIVMLYAQSSLVSSFSACSACSRSFQRKEDVRSGGGASSSPLCTAWNLHSKQRIRPHRFLVLSATASVAGTLRGLLPTTRAPVQLDRGHAKRDACAAESRPTAGQGARMAHRWRRTAGGRR